MGTVGAGWQPEIKQQMISFTFTLPIVAISMEDSSCVYVVTAQSERRNSRTLELRRLTGGTAMRDAQVKGWTEPGR